MDAMAHITVFVVVFSSVLFTSSLHFSRAARLATTEMIASSVVANSSASQRRSVVVEAPPPLLVPLSSLAQHCV